MEVEEFELSRGQNRRMFRSQDSWKRVLDRTAQCESDFEARSE